MSKKTYFEKNIDGANDFDCGRGGRVCCFAGRLLGCYFYSAAACQIARQMKRLHEW